MFHARRAQCFCVQSNDQSFDILGAQSLPTSFTFPSLDKACSLVSALGLEKLFMVIFRNMDFILTYLFRMLWLICMGMLVKFVKRIGICMEMLRGN